jgi:hypothetical protein
MLHIIPGERMVFIQQRTKGGKLTLKFGDGNLPKMIQSQVGKILGGGMNPTKTNE